MLWFLLLTPIVAPLILKFVFPHKVTFKEIAVGIIFSIILITTVYIVGEKQSLADVQILNGGITDKSVSRFACPMNTVNPCRNGYACNHRTVRYTTTCTSTSSVGGKMRTRTRPCTKTRVEHDMCYRYPWEQNWYVSSSIHSNKIEINRIDPQGAQTPLRWEIVNVGDPVSRQQTYDNYIQAASNSLFNEDGQILERYKDLVPAYPINIHDIYNYDRIVTINGATVLNEKELNQLISKELVILGRAKQVNIIVVFAEKLPPDVMHAVRRAWEGFNKNDVAVFVGTNGGIVEWAGAMSWSKNSLVNVTIRDKILDNFLKKQIDNTVLTEIIASSIKQHYVRRPMAEFEYLKADIQIPVGLLTFLWLFSILGTAAFSYLSYKYDPFGDDKPSIYKRNNTFRKLRG